MRRKRIYTGVGSREVHTLPDANRLIKSIAERMDYMGFTLRTGDAIGADRSFRNGSSRSEVYAAYQFSPEVIVVPMEGFSVTDAAFQMARSVHGNWDACTLNAKLLHRRNAFQVLGRDLRTPSDLLICWTRCGAESGEECVFDKKKGISTGGTATAIKIASLNSIPIVNVSRPEWGEKLDRILTELQIR